MAEREPLDSAHIFDRRMVRRHRDRAAFRFSEYDFLFREVAARLVDRLADINRTFGRAVDLGSHGGILRRALAGSGKIDWLVETDLSCAMVSGLRRAGAASAAQAGGGVAVVADEEFLPFAPGSVDLVLSNLSLHWVNDLPGTLLQIRRALRPDGLFLGAMLGGDTLGELRRVLIEAETAATGGAAPRVSPFADLGDAAALLQRAGFALPVADSDTITVTYPDAIALMRDLKGLGEANAVAARPAGFTRRTTLFEAAARYAALFGDADGRVPATFQVLYMLGWAPHESQQKPLRPGSAAARLADALGSDEKPAGEKVGPSKKK
jgi:SAM-dependent methyltransferase